MNTKEQAQYDDLSIRYLSGNSDPTETKKLEQWVLADPANKQHFMQLKKAWILTGMQEQEQMDQDHVEAAWQNVERDTISRTKVVPMSSASSVRNWLMIAATLAAFAAAAIGTSYFFYRTNDLSVASESEAKTITLPDGSEVRLNQNSRLSYQIAEGQRKVKLAGDAFFDVRKQTSNPFVIYTEGLQIEVLGTSFYVDSRQKAQEVQVIVQEGKVQVSKEAQKVVLTAGQKASYSKASSLLQRRPNQDGNFASIKTQKLVFSDSRMDEVVFALNRHFGSNIVFAEESLKNCRLVSSFNNKNLESILKIIESSLGLKVEDASGVISLSGSCEDG